MSGNPATVILALRDELMAVITNNHRLSSAGQHKLYPCRFFPPPLPSLSEMFELVDVVSLQSVLTTTQLTLTFEKAGQQFTRHSSDDHRWNGIIGISGFPGSQRCFATLGS